MPLSKARDAARKRQSRLDGKRLRESVQPKPKYVVYEGRKIEIPELDADDNVIYSDE